MRLELGRTAIEELAGRRVDHHTVAGIRRRAEAGENPEVVIGGLVSPQRPLYCAYHEYPEVVQRWLDEEFVAIKGWRSPKAPPSNSGTRRASAP